MKRTTRFNTSRKTLRCRVAVTVVAAVIASASFAHPATEVYVPIGYWESVGVSGTYLGPLITLEPQAKSLSFRDDGIETAVRITDKTRVYIDRSHLGLTNKTGSRDDLRPGATVEIRMSTSDPGAADWIKIRADR